MSFFTANTTLIHRTPLPPSTSFPTAVSLLHNRDFIMRLDPELVSYEECEAPKVPNPGMTPNDSTTFYKVVDHMEALPRWVWDTTVEFQLEFKDTELGNERFVHAPLGLTQKSVWEVVKSDVEEAEGGAEWTLLETTNLSCSRLLVGIIKAKYEENWRDIHGKYVKGLEEGKGVVENGAVFEANGKVAGQ